VHADHAVAALNSTPYRRLDRRGRLPGRL